MISRGQAVLAVGSAGQPRRCSLADSADPGYLRAIARFDIGPSRPAGAAELIVAVIVEAAWVEATRSYLHRQTDQMSMYRLSDYELQFRSFRRVSVVDLDDPVDSRPDGKPQARTRYLP